MKKKTLAAIGGVSLILAGSCFYAATTFLNELAREKLYAPVVKVAYGKELMPFEPITSDDVYVEQEEIDEILPDAFRALDEVLGKRSMHPIFAGEQIIKQKIDENHLLPGPKEARYEFSLSLMMPGNHGNAFHFLAALSLLQHRKTGFQSDQLAAAEMV